MSEQEQVSGIAATAHLTPDDLGAYIDGTLESYELPAIESHLAECAECRTEALAMERLISSSTSGGGRRRAALWLLPTAAAAAIAALILVNPDDPDRGATEDPTLRGGDVESIVQIQPIGPTGGAAVDPTAITFSWQPVEDDLIYRVTLMDESGAVVWNGDTAETSVTLPADIALEPGTLYYWHVDALLDLGRSVTSGVQEFMTEP